VFTGLTGGPSDQPFTCLPWVIQKRKKPSYRLLLPDGMRRSEFLQPICNIGRLTN
jgi:hypothetical protein